MGLSEIFDGSEYEEAYNQLNDSPHKAEISTELIAAAAAYEAVRAYVIYCNVNGKPDSHAKAKELLADWTHAYVDRIVETKGLDFVDKEKAKSEAIRKADEGLVDSDEY